MSRDYLKVGGIGRNLQVHSSHDRIPPSYVLPEPAEEGLNRTPPVRRSQLNFGSNSRVRRTHHMKGREASATMIGKLVYLHVFGGL